jgi:ATP-dependent Lon protease
MDPVPSALKDRMEVIRLSGYSAEEKLHIAERYLIPRQREANGLKENQARFSKNALLKLITEYTAEAGLRNLEREIGSICRKIARQFAEGRRKKPVTVTETAVARFLGAPRFLPEEERDKNEIGVVTGLAWTEVGGEVLLVEVNTMKGKGALTLTGHLGEVMKESAQAALSYARAHADELGIAPDYFETHDLHVHVPAGAIPKDGPSAGVTMVTAMISALTRKPVAKDVAMTGEITLRGKVLPIGGLKEKVLAAVRHHVKTVLVPARNEKDMDELPPHLRRKVRLILVRNIEEVLEHALVDET